MPALETRPFRTDDIAAAARLLADRHVRARARFALLPPRFEDADACAELVRSAMSLAEGVVARDGDRLAGFLFAAAILYPPDRPSTRFTPPRSSMMFAHGHAVAAGADPFATYHALLAALAPPLVDRGILAHTVHLPAGEPALDAAWFDLGFGRVHAFAARDLAPLSRASPPDVLVREATREDLDVAERLADEEARFHARAPIWDAYVAADTAAGTRRELEELIASADGAVLLAALEGRDVGLTTVSAATGGPLFIPDDALGIGTTAVFEDARGRGVGAALVERALAWGRARERRHATLHFSTANAASRPFWTGLGFTPVLWHLVRLLDERLPWARPRD
jgi:GNAT superfamily N-acetyltransferase